MVKACEEILDKFNTIAPHLKWDDNDDGDPFAKDILGARLRAKFYGARVITYRDFVLKILQRSSEASMAQDETNPNNATRILGPASSPEAEIEPITIQYAEQCIKALIRSTMAFHGIGEPGRHRLIVTNIWGTAHAYVPPLALRLSIVWSRLTFRRQWGNILTLQAAYMDPVLSRFVSREQLRGLSVKTLAFLRLHAHRSSALYIDYKILLHTGRVTGLVQDKDQPQIGSVNSSFGSQASRDVLMARG